MCYRHCFKVSNWSKYWTHLQQWPSVSCSLWTINDQIWLSFPVWDAFVETEQSVSLCLWIWMMLWLIGMSNIDRAVLKESLEGISLNIWSPQLSVSPLCSCQVTSVRCLAWRACRQESRGLHYWTAPESVSLPSHLITTPRAWEEDGAVAWSPK